MFFNKAASNIEGFLTLASAGLVVWFVKNADWTAVVLVVLISLAVNIAISETSSRLSSRMRKRAERHEAWRRDENVDRPKKIKWIDHNAEGIQRLHRKY